MADYFNARYIHANETLGVAMGERKPIQDISRFKEYLARLKEALSHIKDEYFMWLEDDVLINQPYTEAFVGTINGNCVNKIRSDIFRRISYYTGDCSEKFFSGHGGSIYNKAQFLAIMNRPEIEWLIDHWTECTLMKTLDNDFFFCIALWTLGGTVHPLQQHADGYFNAPVCHQFKQYYNINPDSTIQSLVKVDAPVI